jgi:hypothetical protein
MAMPPGRNGPPSRQPGQSGKPAWPMRHPVWTGLAVIAALLAVIAAGAHGNGAKSAGSATADGSPRPTATPTVRAAAELSCRASAVVWRPADQTIAKIRVRTVAGAQVTASGPLAWLHGGGAAIRTNASGAGTLRFRVGNATPGSLVVITVSVSSSGSIGSCHARLRPRAGAVTAAAPAQPTTPPPAAQPPAPQPQASCYPISDEGTCYEPGEFCRDDDHGMTGLAGDGETIVCEDNDGWRWEPV